MIKEKVLLHLKTKTANQPTDTKEKIRGKKGFHQIEKAERELHLKKLRDLIENLKM